jgi:adenylate cyclase
MTRVAAIKRRLAAVAFADVAGWSRLVEKSDIDALLSWKALRRELIEPKVEEHGGRLLEVAGDAVLIEFSSAVAAVTWAMETQRSLKAKHDDDTAVELSVRIGINVEDVIVDEDKLIGDGVNIASRIHQFASPGEIIVTAAVHGYVWNKMPVSFSDLGERALKNISRPVQIFRVEATEHSLRIPLQSQPHLAWTRRPGIAVLPFRNLGGNPEEGYFGEGMTEDIISGLSRSRALYVIARNSTLRYRDYQMDARDIASELGVRYIVQGSVRRQTARLRISAELIDAVDNRTVWADKFDGANEEIFDIQDRIAGRIVGIIEPRLYEMEAKRAMGKHPENLDAYECVLRALALLYSFNEAEFAEAGRYLQRAVRLDPGYAQAHAYLAWWYNLAAGERRSTDPVEDAEKAERASKTAIDLDPSDAFALAVAAHIQAFLHKKLDPAVEMFDRALLLNENSAFAWGISGSTYCFLGRPNDAMERLRNAWRLSPFDPLNFFFWTVAGIAEFVAGRYDQSIGWLRKAQRVNTRFVACHRTLAAALAHSGDIEAAKEVAQQLLRIEPRFTVSNFVSWYPLRKDDDRERLATGLKLAGLPA